MKKILMVLILGLVVWSCSKKDDPEAEGTPMEMLAGQESKVWRLSFAEARDKDGASVPLMLLYDCWADNTLTLYRTGNYTLEDTGKRCVDSENVNSSWSLSEDEKEIRLAKFTIAGQEFENLAMELKEVKNSSFAGVARNVSYGGLVASEVELRFQVVNN